MSEQHHSHVLLVEDDPIVLDHLRFLLETWGHSVTVARDGLRGIEQALAAHPDVIVIDIGLPLVDGCEVARQVRDAGGDILLIAVSGSISWQDQLRVKTAGFDLFLPKPVDPEILRRSLEPVSQN
jgi:two-component system, sensor histidine kinase